MARRGRNQLAGLTRALEQVPAESIDGALAAFARHGERRAASALNGSATVMGYPLVTKLDRVRNTKRQTRLIVFGSPAGFWSWIENGTTAHTVRARARQTPTGRPPAMFGGLDHPIAGEVQVGGMQAQRAWTRTVDDVDADIADVVTAAFDETIGR